MGISTLTKKQKAILDYIKSFQKTKGYSPTLEEVGKRFKLSSPATVHQYLSVLCKKGYVQRQKGHARSIEIFQNGISDLVEIPLMGIITAGKPIEAIQNPEPIEVQKNMLSKTGRHYALKVDGNSMINEGISDGDTVIVREQSVVENEESAVAFLPDKNEATLKKIYKEKNRIRLQPANPEMKPFYEKNVEIQGKIVGILRKVK